eukprot:CAMPEP_0119004056 /NCGR_PEP_ID=MMETSP1176-20130426/926_1 /TAXON_ID=265551 /ORGANISM="Synedropsis recta cf, Strain CCMP1620" /LENGTH=222 /DNA_ID=CAMNT_0006955725 /DNA_START=60 /DNA_END=728 /DNA_ORIENTATION=+
MTTRPPSFLLLALLVCLGLPTSIQACFHEENSTRTASPITSRLLETDSAYSLVLDIPGVKPKDLDLSMDYDDRRLSVTGIVREDDNAATPVEPDMSYYQSYRIVDDNVNLYDLTMSYNDGVVTVSIPKPATPTIRKRKKTKIRGANTTKNKTNNPLVQQQEQQTVLSTAHRATPASAELLHHTRHDAAAPPRSHPDISIVHAPRIAEMSEIDEEFEYWNHLI